MAAFDEDEIFGSNDDDILQKNTPQSSNPSTHVIPLGKGIPGYLASALQRYVDEHPDILNQAFNANGRSSRAIPLPVSLFNELSGVLSDISEKNMRMPSYRAVLHVLNEMTEGHLQRVTAVYEMERALLALHECLFTMNAVFMAMQGYDKSPTINSAHFSSYVGVYLEIAMFSLEDLKARYEVCCQYANMEPNKEIAEFGMVDFADFPFANTFSAFHNVKSHFILGNTSPMLEIVTKLGELMAISFTELVYTGEPIPQNDE